MSQLDGTCRQMTANDRPNPIPNPILNHNHNQDTPLNPPTVSLSLEQVIEVYEKNICLPGTTINEETENELKIAVQQFSAPWVIDAIREACLQNNPTLRYIGGILRTWRKEGKPL
jgi:DnaD/phage-associated family protein